MSDITGIITTAYENEKIKISFDLTSVKDLNIDELIDSINKHFVEKVMEEIITPSVFIPNDFVLKESEGIFIDVYYHLKDVKYPNEYVEKLDKEYLAGNGEIGKNLFFIEKENGVLNIEFTSLVVETVEGELVSMWEYKNGAILSVFKKLLNSLV